MGNSMRFGKAVNPVVMLPVLCATVAEAEADSEEEEEVVAGEEEDKAGETKEGAEMDTDLVFELLLLDDDDNALVPPSRCCCSLSARSFSF